MRHAALASLLVALLIGLFAAPRASEAAASVTLTVSPASITFPDLNPDLSPLITGTPVVNVSVRVTGNAAQQAWTLTIAATDHLRSGADAITANNITWTSSRTNAPWQPGGTLQVAPPQTVAGGRGNQNTQTSTLTFSLANLWTHSPGNYTSSMVLTLSAP